MKYAVKDLRETFATGFRHELHVMGCAHLKIGAAQTGFIEAESVEEAIKKDEAENYDAEWSPKMYRVAPCLKNLKV